MNLEAVVLSTVAMRRTLMMGMFVTMLLLLPGPIWAGIGAVSRL